MTRWYLYYCVLRAIWSDTATRVELEDVLNQMLAEARDSFPDGKRPTTLQLHEFMNHVAQNPYKFKQNQLNHLINIEGWCL